MLRQRQEALCAALVCVGVGSLDVNSLACIMHIVLVLLLMPFVSWRPFCTVDIKREGSRCRLCPAKSTALHVFDRVAAAQLCPQFRSCDVILFRDVPIFLCLSPGSPLLRSKCRFYCPVSHQRVGAARPRHIDAVQSEK